MMGAYGWADAFQIGDLPFDLFLVPVEDLKQTDLLWIAL